MEKVKLSVCFVALFAYAVVNCAGVQGQQPQKSSGELLYSQSISRALEDSFLSSRVEYLVLDLRINKFIAERWSHPEQAIPVGSVLKPFVALAYSKSHSVRFPIVHCAGTQDRCWRKGGHGALGLERALQVSCNAYFLSLAEQVSTDDLSQVSKAYKLPLPSMERLTPEAMIGLTPNWRVTPRSLAEAYRSVAANSEDAVVDRLLPGMRMAAQPGGTAASIGTHPGGVMAKTGTASCEEDCVANGDGLVVVLAPELYPRLLLLVRERGTTGGHAAQCAGRILQTLEKLDAIAR